MREVRFRGATFGSELFHTLLFMLTRLLSVCVVWILPCTRYPNVVSSVNLQSLLSCGNIMLLLQGIGVWKTSSTPPLIYLYHDKELSRRVVGSMQS
jgi:hypothetical protein